MPKPVKLDVFTTGPGSDAIFAFTLVLMPIVFNTSTTFMGDVELPATIVAVRLSGIPYCIDIQLVMLYVKLAGDAIEVSIELDCKAFCGMLALPEPCIR